MRPLLPGLGESTTLTIDTQTHIVCCDCVLAIASVRYSIQWDVILYIPLIAHIDYKSFMRSDHPLDFTTSRRWDRPRNLFHMSACILRFYEYAVHVSSKNVPQNPYIVDGCGSFSSSLLPRAMKMSFGIKVFYCNRNRWSLDPIQNYLLHRMVIIWLPTCLVPIFSGWCLKQWCCQDEVNTESSDLMFLTSLLAEAMHSLSLKIGSDSIFMVPLQYWMAGIKAAAHRWYDIVSHAQQRWQHLNE